MKAYNILSQIKNLIGQLEVDYSTIEDKSLNLECKHNFVYDTHFTRLDNSSWYIFVYHCTNCGMVKNKGVNRYQN